MSSINDATVTVPYQSLRALEEQNKAMKADQEKHEEQLKEALLRGGDGAAKAYREAFFVVFRIVQYSLAHLDPMTFRGWPYKDVFALSALLKTLPYLPAEISEIATDLGILAKEGKKWEDARAAGAEQLLLVEENARHSGVPTADET